MSSGDLHLAGSSFLCDKASLITTASARQRLRLAVVAMVIVTLFSLDTLSAATSPVDQGALNLGGSYMMSRYKGETNSSWSTSRTSVIWFSIAVNGFIRPGLAIGFQLTSLQVKRSGEFSSYSIGPRIAYYFRREMIAGDGSGEAFPYAAISYQYGEYESWVYRSAEYVGLIGPGTSVHSLRLSGGLDYMATREIGVTTELTYEQDFYQTSHEGTKRGYGIILSLGLSFFVW